MAEHDIEPDITFDYIGELVGSRTPVILDVGANNGQSSLQFSKLFPEGRIYSFEPDQRAIAKFRNVVKRGNVQLIETAVGGYDGVEFHKSGGAPPNRDVEGGWDLSGSIRAPKEHLTDHPWCTFDETVKVPITTLDTWFGTSGLSGIDFIWADVQGAEEDLIKGARATLAKTRYFYTEYSNRELYEGQRTLEELCEMLPDFELIHRYSHDVLFRNIALKG